MEDYENEEDEDYEDEDGNDENIVYVYKRDVSDGSKYLGLGPLKKTEKGLEVRTEFVLEATDGFDPERKGKLAFERFPDLEALAKKIHVYIGDEYYFPIKIEVHPCRDFTQYLDIGHMETVYALTDAEKKTLGDHLHRLNAEYVDATIASGGSVRVYHSDKRVL